MVVERLPKVRLHTCCVGQKGGQIEDRGYAMVHHQRQGPRDYVELSMGKKCEHEEEDDGEDPQSDGHKHHPAVCRHQSVAGACYYGPVDHSQKYFSHHEDGRDASDEGYVHLSGDVSSQPSETVAPLL